MILRAAERYPVRVGGALLGALDAEAGLSLVWPPWYPAGADERAKDAATLTALSNAGLLRMGAVRRWLDGDWGVGASAPDGVATP